MPPNSHSLFYPLTIIHQQHITVTVSALSSLPGACLKTTPRGFYHCFFSDQSGSSWLRGSFSALAGAGAGAAGSVGGSSWKVAGSRQAARAPLSAGAELGRLVSEVG